MTATTYADLDDFGWRAVAEAEQPMRWRRPPVFRHYTQRAALAPPVVRQPLPRPHAEDCEFWASDGDEARACTCNHRLPDQEKKS